MPGDDKDLSVSEGKGYSAQSTGPAQDTDVLVSREDIHADRPAHIEHHVRNRAGEDPLAGLRRNVRTQTPVEDVPPDPPNRTMLVGGIAIFAVLGVVGLVVLALSGDPEPPPAENIQADAQVEEPAPEPPPKPQSNSGRADLGRVYAVSSQINF